MNRVTQRAALCASLLALASWSAGCGDDDEAVDGGAGIDAGDEDTDAGDEETDAGDEETDAGDEETDAGDEETDAGGGDAGTLGPAIRLAHLIPGEGDVHVCLSVPGSATTTLLTRNTGTGEAQPVPYRGISNYVRFPLPPVARVKVYRASELSGTPLACPAATVVPLITRDVNRDAELIGAEYFTVAAMGLPAGTGATEPGLVILGDEVGTPPPAGEIRIRVVHAIPNLLAPGPTPVPAIDVCFDPDGPGATAAVQLFDDLEYKEAAAFVVRAPITAGVLAIHVSTAGTDCPDATRLQQIPVPLPIPTGGALPPNVVNTFAADGTFSLFAVGDGTRAIPPTACTTPGMTDCGGFAGAVCTAGNFCFRPDAPTVIPWWDTAVPLP